LTAQAYVGAESVDEPVLTAARVGATQPHHVAEAKLHDLRGVRGHYSNPQRIDAL
jgi:hypothetical protein